MHLIGDLSHARLGDDDNDDVGTRPSEIEINASSHLSSARNLSLLLLVLLVASIDVSLSHVSQVKDLIVARRELAMDHAAKEIEALADSIDDDRAEPARQWLPVRGSGT